MSQTPDTASPADAPAQGGQVIPFPLNLAIGTRPGVLVFERGGCAVFADRAALAAQLAGEFPTAAPMRPPLDLERAQAQHRLRQLRADWLERQAERRLAEARADGFAWSVLLGLLVAVFAIGFLG